MPLVQKLLFLNGRAARPSMMLITTAFLFTGLLRVRFAEAGVNLGATIALVVQLALLWPALVAIPVKRFHDMDRGSWWVALFWGGAAFSFLFLIAELQSTGSLVDMSAIGVLQQPEVFVEAITALNADRSEEDAIKLLGGSGMGGISLAIIFLLIQFGWLHFIPGTPGSNRFGPVAGHVETTR